MCNFHDNLKHLGISLARPPDAIEQIGAIVHLSVTYKNKVRIQYYIQELDHDASLFISQAEYEMLAYGLSLGELEAIMATRNMYVPWSPAQYTYLTIELTILLAPISS